MSKIHSTGDYRMTEQVAKSCPTHAVTASFKACFDYCYSMVTSTKYIMHVLMLRPTIPVMRLLLSCLLISVFSAETYFVNPLFS